MENAVALYPYLATPQKIVITMHQKPDGDAMGAALGMFHFLKKLGHEAVVVSPTNWAKFLNWIPGCKNVVDFEKNVAKAQAVVESSNLIFCLDFNAFHRTRKMEDVLRNYSGTRILIDHHEQPDTNQFHCGISDVSKCSTCEMVYDFIIESPWADLMDEEIATCLYTGIMTDTGSFRFSITTPQVHRKVAHLLELGVRQSPIHDNIFDTYSENRLRFIGNALLNRMEVMYEYNTTFMYIPKKDLTRYEIQTGDTEGLVNYLLTIEDIKLAALLIDRIEERKWSFRSKGDFDVNQFARLHFNGGGHKNAAGGRSLNSLEENVHNFKSVIMQYKDQLQ